MNALNPRAVKAVPAGRRQMLLRSALALASLSVLVACGGGGSADTDASTGGTPGASTLTAFTSGSISGFGSVIVNGVRFDDSNATVEDDDGGRHGRDDLKLGASVEIESSSVDLSTGRATATAIRFGSEIVGPVEAIDLTLGQFTLLGQVVEVSSTTVFEASLAGGLNALTLDSVLEVHARWDAARSVYLASRVEPKTSASAYKVRGTLAALDTAGQTFRIGTALISYANATKLPALLADGQRVRVKLQTAAVNGRWLATEVKSAERKVEDHSEAEVQGLITAITSATSFSVDGLAVDASGATFRDGQAGIVLGARVEVSGAVVNGVLVATKVHLEDGSDDSHEAYELHGAISALDTTTMRFALRGLTVDYSAVAEWRSLSAAQLANGLKLEVKGALSADGTTVTATRISLED